MKKNKAVRKIFVSDSNYVPVHVYTKQDQKYYEYIPRIGDKFILKFMDSETKDLKHTQTVEVQTELAENYILKLDALEAGKYLLDVRINTIDGDTHIIANDMLIEVEED